MRPRNRKRRGVLLLVVLSLLVLFMLAGATFVVTAGQYRRASQSAPQVERTGYASPGQLLDTAVMQLVRGPRAGMNSQAEGHSLLYDLYGIDHSPGQFDANTSFSRVADGELISIYDVPVSTTGGSGYYNGSILTITSGAANGQSTRILKYVESWGVANLVIEAFPEFAPRNDLELRQALDRAQFVINGKPFNGTGYGYTTGTLSQDALRVATVDRANDLGGSDESYDAPDFQNMFLAWVPEWFGSITNQYKYDNILPSFHRPALLNYWRVNGLNFADVLIRPWETDHPNFSGSNPYLDPNSTLDLDPELSEADERLDRLIKGYVLVDPDGDGQHEKRSIWDVDNDGDGVNDSIWIDLGIAAQLDQQGRAYKPLFAVMCIDLDGRVNVNTAGTLTGAQVEGHGTGPFEVSLQSVLTANAARLINGSGEYAGRYNGASSLDGSNVPGRFDGDDETYFPLKNLGIPFNYQDQMGSYEFDESAFASPPDLLGQGQVFISADGMPTMANMGNPDETLNDPYEINPIACDASDFLFTDSDMDLLLRGIDSDSLTFPARLRQLVPEIHKYGRYLTTRSFSIPAPSIQYGPESRRVLTPSAPPQIRDLFPWDAPTPDDGMGAYLKHGMIAWELLAGQKLNLNRLWGDGKDNDGDGLIDEPIDMTDQNGQVSPQLRMALGQGDLSRLRNLMPEYFEISIPQPLGNPAITLANFFNAKNYELVTGGKLNIPAQAPMRQLFARHLYCLAMALRYDPDTIDGDADFDPVTNPPLGQVLNRDREIAKELAQWAINVVDFRDADSIMTPFEYDPNPYDGWDVDGDLHTDEIKYDHDQNPGTEDIPFVAWGCERPELLITETVAWHDRRRADLEFDYTVNGEEQTNQKTTDPDTNDRDFDQPYAPNGPFFVELYNPWTSSDTGLKPPASLYGTGSTQGVRLYDGNRSIWRLVVVESKDDNADDKPDGIPPYDDPHDPAIGTQNDHRLISFAPTGGIETVNGPKRFKPLANDISDDVIPSLGHLIVGTKGIELAAGKYISTMGFTVKDANGDPTDLLTSVSELLNQTPTRRVSLEVSSAPTSNTPLYHGNVEVVGTNGTQSANVAVVVIDSLSVSEPTDGYSEVVKDAARDSQDYPSTLKNDGTIQPPLDRPIEDAFDKDTRTHLGYSFVYLQRLADPSRSFDEDTNPYITVDVSNVDLTVFNGASSDVEADDDNDRADREFDRKTGGRNGIYVDFRARQRGDDTEISNNPQRPLWPTVSFAKRILDADSIDIEPGTLTDLPHHFEFLLEPHSLGTLSRAYTQSPEHSPWFTWNNRPFTNHLELVLVPRSSPGRLLMDFSIATNVTSANIYGANSRAFQHLSSFFSNAPRANGDLFLARILDYVEVPSPYVGAERWYDANDFQFVDEAATFRTPFNRLPRFRNPGLVNLNTVSGPTVWKAIDAGSMNIISWSDVDDSRRGQKTGMLSPPDVDYTRIHDKWPTQFANPFRSVSAGDLMPLESMRLKGPDGINASVLREALSDQSEFWGVPLFYGKLYSSPEQNAARNPYFFFKPLSRLGNLVSNQSNVFAVWITVGYFEVDAAGELGQELGCDTGEINRHRAFYMIDRSIPVGFEPGKDHNVADTILLRRFIE